jgi:hypothetical protein
MSEQEINAIINVQDFIETIDAVLYYCQQTGLEIETAAELIKKNAKLKARVRVDAESAGYLPKSAKLPI